MQVDEWNRSLATASSPLMQLYAALCDYAGGRRETAGSPSREPLQRRFEVIARTTPCAVAVDFNGRRLTYGELDEQADALALHLQAGGLMPGSFCMVDLEPSLAQVRAILAVLKAGAACLLFDSGIAQGAAAAVLAAFRPALRFTRGGHASRVEEEMKTICCDEDAADLPYGWPDELPVGPRTPAWAYAQLSADGDLCISVRTHQALGASLDGASRPAPALGADPGGLWQPLSSGAPLTIQARAWP
ncbi:AMP-binding protein [Massilia niastensis]|uniref:AMP-binding protein n=1 Tax=Massilia niastensis TaxID=544911 RepID=UPI0003A245AE|nr:AMP-binding protein [Massilia niastensis]